MISNESEYQKARDELKSLESWFKRLNREHTGAGKGMTKAGIRKLMARLHEELAVYEGSQELAELKSKVG